MKNNKLPDQFYLQQKIKSILDEEGISSKKAVEYLRDLVKSNLKSFRDEFNEDFPITNKREDIIKRNNEIVSIKTKYFFDVYFQK